MSCDYALGRHGAEWAFWGALLGFLSVSHVLPAGRLYSQLVSSVGCCPRQRSASPFPGLAPSRVLPSFLSQTLHFPFTKFWIRTLPN